MELGFSWLSQINVDMYLKQKFNVYVKFTFDYLHNFKRFETKFFILDKSKTFDENLSLLKMKYVFPNRLVKVELFTDNKKVIPNEFLEEKQKQLILNFV
ncbi:hypothetical protein CRU98_10080 [Arcobacter sp. CECT 8986]|uniref:hypothetical protein n=1 Tax=Arcobacter sp. CECT 8986 TaxID=2044507 RepID=UPI001009C4D1|nr:hypothetical protein [Arcobacter sp. CECT 8986]RXJ98377.1 hypothetical protein CRU98_10080 [Arcobacter sp. CECT 8986]